MAASKSNSKFHNWIKSALAVLFTKEEIEPVVYNEIEQFQQQCLQDIATSNNIPQGTICCNCNTENFVRCPTDRICNVRRDKCSYHRLNTTQYNPSGCPNNICHHLKSDIQNAHRYHSPSFKNTDAKQWCSNPWEIAKCYMPPDGYNHVTNPADTDFNGIISIIINHKGIGAKISDDLSKKNNIFDQGREVGKASRHSATLEVEETDLTKYFTILNIILTDPGFMTMNKSPHNALQKLAELQNDELVIGMDIVSKVLDDTGNAIQEKIRKETGAYEDKAKQMIDLANKKLTCIENQGTISVAKLEDVLKSSIDALVSKKKDINFKIEHGKQDIKDGVEHGKQKINDGAEYGKQEIKDGVEQGRQKINDGVEQGKKKIKERVELGKQELNDGVEDGIYPGYGWIKDEADEEKHNIGNIRAGAVHRVKEEERALRWIKKVNEDQMNEKVKQNKSIWLRIWQRITYPQRKKELKEQLIRYYKNKQSTFPLSPLVEEKDTPLAGFYVMPDMVLVKQKSEIRDQEERSPINSLTDLLDTESENQQQIYVSADAGFGKTSFSKYLAITWSQVCSPDRNQKCFKDKELQALAKFEFVFLVLLRESTTVCTIDEMIEQQIIKKLPWPASQYLLQDILQTEKCLIILDGLDEWTHPNICRQKEKIPHRYACGDNCVIITTSRPWKLWGSNLKASDVNKKVELVKLNIYSTIQLEKNAIRKMSNIRDDVQLRMKTLDLQNVIASRGLEHMQSIPLLLMYVTCLWCNKIPIGNSKVEVYFNIIEFLLSRTAQIRPDVHPSQETSHFDIPEYLKKHKYCQMFFSLLMALAKLAYHTIYNMKRENTLVFDGSVVKRYLKADDMQFSLLSGILTGSSERSSKVSFSHKTVQELFAAIYISSESHAQETFLEKYVNVQSILDMSMIFEFLSKMNSKMICEISAGLMCVINEDEVTRNYRTRTYDEWYIKSEPLYNIQKMLLSCLQEMPQRENIKLCLQDFFIDEDKIYDERLQRLSKQNKTNMKSLYINIPHFFSISLREIIACFDLTDLNNLYTLCYCGDKNDADISLLLFQNLQRIVLSCVTWTNYDRNLCEKLISLRNIKYLQIENLTFSHEILQLVSSFICSNKTIKELTLSELSCKEHSDRGCKINLNLYNNSQLKKVRLMDISLDESSWLLSRDMFNLERVELCLTNMYAESLQNMVAVLEEIPQRVTIEMHMSDIKPDTEYERVKHYIIENSQTFVVTHDSMWWFEFQTRKPSAPYDLNCVGAP